MDGSSLAQQFLGKQIYVQRKIAKPEIDLNVQFELVDKPKNKCYAVRIAATVALEGAWISCSAPIHFLVPATASYEMTKTESETEQKLGNKFNATLRFRPNCTSAEFCFRTVEGCSGFLEIFVSAVNSTGRCTQRETIRIAPLSTYRRISAVDQSRSFNILQIKGTFSPLKVQSWMSSCFEDIEKLGYKLSDHEGTFSFESILLGSHLLCQIKEEELVFHCENPTTLAVLMQFFTRQATQEKTKLDIRPKIVPETCADTLARIDRILAPISGRDNIKNLRQAVTEITAAEGAESMLHPAFRSDGWRKLQGIDSGVDGDCEISIDFMHALIVDLMKDYAKLCGRSIMQRLPELANILSNDYSLRNLHNFLNSV
ncbi:uncharacterized protein LOC129584846 [Paramacrobiotus metropolitanus]|uniref:uncharacterized protein LOC129584846 n=1 Tax=Paramacrobiotus metropolitanus TaxID=2943436 RepID=UPI0024459363|nr:uncharacterized protein LOC129584846 [Paramacrobiotus metropolitanus]XP_055333165.1 uncharacterized protein LOC129584846 [Paramacrobiotus metropolitanus]